RTIKFLELSEMPTPNEDGVALIEFQVKNDGGTSAKVFVAKLECC
ncbi:unnamed protein product, partial [marine sediment metagenome]